MVQSEEDKALNDFNIFQKRVTDIYPADKALEFVVLTLTSSVGRLAAEVALITRGDYENKGVFSYEEAINRIMEECTSVMGRVSLVATVLEKHLSDVIEHGKDARRMHNM